MRQAKTWYLGLPLIRQFLPAFAIVLTLAMAVLGAWINSRATVRVLDATTETAALYLQTVVQPHVQSLASGGTLNGGDRAALDRIANTFADQGQFLRIKIWNLDGTLAYPDNSSGEPPPVQISDLVEEALGNQIVGSISDLSEANHVGERALGVRLYEIHAPLHELETGKMLAVGEFYQNADYIRDALILSAEDNWVMFASAGMAIFFLLWVIVQGGSRTIDRQSQALQDRLAEQDRLFRQNEKLREKILTANQNLARIDEMAHKRVGLDLHDGAAQLLGFLIMQLDRLDAELHAPRRADASTLPEIMTDIRDAASEAMDELRRISTGLVGPHLEGLNTLGEILGAVVSEHRRRTGTEVLLNLPTTLPVVPDHLARTVGRIVQEALNNAFKHAGGKGQRVDLDVNSDASFVVRISDDGPGPGPSMEANATTESRLGLMGMRFRAESLGGQVDVVHRVPYGTAIVCSVPAQ